VQELSASDFAFGIINLSGSSRNLLGQKYYSDYRTQTYNPKVGDVTVGTILNPTGEGEKVLRLMQFVFSKFLITFACVVLSLKYLFRFLLYR
jgi:hypothetical protein